MLYAKILESGPSVFYGSAILRSLKNESDPLIDLLVREAIQNSSDAALSYDGNPDSFTVNFNTGKFDAERFAALFPDSIRVDLCNRRLKNDYLEIRDTATVGLTGGVRAKIAAGDEHENFTKLIFDCGIQQAQEDAGGSWGYGKSVFYRASAAGIVLFYSRIQSGESRLIVTLVEDQSGRNALLNRANRYSAGKAWFGSIDPENNSEVLPITDEQRIAEILDLFGIRPFGQGDEQTGTSVIIPFIDKKSMLQAVLPPDAGDGECLITPDERETYLWARDFEKYLILAIQKWYAPKVMNKTLASEAFRNSGAPAQKYLKAKVNGKAVLAHWSPMAPDMAMRKPFSVVQELYTAAFAHTYGIQYRSEEYGARIVFKDIEVRNYFEGGMKAGTVAIIKMERGELNDGTTDFTALLRKFGEKYSSTIVAMYSRQPGMVINYEVQEDKDAASDEWVTLAFFVPNTNKVLKNTPGNVPQRFWGKSLGNYLKACEAPDHMKWEAKADMLLCDKLLKKVRDAVKDEIHPKDKQARENGDCPLARNLGRKLLQDFKVRPGRENGGGNGGRGGGKTTTFVITNIDCQNESMAILSFSILNAKGGSTATLKLAVSADDTHFRSAMQWEKKTGVSFPFSFTECITENNEIATPGISNDGNEITVKISEDCDEVPGIISMHSSDMSYRFRIDFTAKTTEETDDE